eukprot:Skav204574  [mRNA]  locus=scaffold2218:222481:228735:- [translate_table: standard]
MVSTMLFGVVVGQLFFGAVADSFGRKWAFVCTAGLTVFSSLASALCWHDGMQGQGLALPMQLAMCRFILGCGVGGEYPLSLYSLGSFKSSIFETVIHSTVAADQVFDQAFFAAITSTFAILGFLAGMLFFILNAGPNLTTYVLPAEIFPTCVRATCHGISAASGKLGAFLGTAAFPLVQRYCGAMVAGCGGGGVAVGWWWMGLGGWGWILGIELVRFLGFIEFGC